MRLGYSMDDNVMHVVGALAPAAVSCQASDATSVRSPVCKWGHAQTNRRGLEGAEWTRILRKRSDGIKERNVRENVWGSSEAEGGEESVGHVPCHA